MQFLRAILFHLNISIENVSLQRVLCVFCLRTGGSMSARCFPLNFYPLHYFAKEQNSPKLIFMSVV